MHTRDTARDPFRVYDEDHDDDFRDNYGDGGLLEDFDCLFPGNCCMPELHFPSECHTPEMAAEFYGYEEDSAALDEGETVRADEALPDEDEPPF